MALHVLAAFGVAAAMAGCVEPGVPPNTDVAATPTANVRDRHSIQSFAFIADGTTMQQVISSLGVPDSDIGSGIHIFVYSLSDGSEVRIGSPDGSAIWYVRHGAAVLYERD